MTIRVLNKRHGGQGVYIGRPSPLGNPFVIGRDGNRDEVIAKYQALLEVTLEGRSQARTEFNRLVKIYRETGELNLVCWCAPRACHGDVIKEQILNRIVEVKR
ncbi:conserved hypothetical protein [Nitrosococcus halophilus Nc 4]|uniref:DUF4326 domain-containing protein n=1 Tax=Nitrosococcus halophilus (strain Nc4) TaxID=472759 RepID=D5BYF2_NITHN|nr:DUF4326 domain-containing protein [Nitrosococcus halophilus]ADE14135.1 conserved hypothetical protein [Nitrosococcus halophilus Nc 4]